MTEDGAGRSRRSDAAREAKDAVHPTSTPPSPTANGKQDSGKRRHAAAIIVLLELRRRFPDAFARLSAKKRQPLAIGIDKAIAAAMPDIDVAQLRLALAVYVGHPAYLRHCTEGAVRIGLDGSAAGVVTAEQAAYAKLRLEKFERRHSKKHAAPSPARLTLSDLREAAAARRRAAGEGAS